MTGQYDGAGQDDGARPTNCVAVTAADWDARVDRALAGAPNWMHRSVVWLRRSDRRGLRVVAGLLLVAGGICSILPVLGLWMLPLGLALLGEDRPWLKVLLERAARWVESRWTRTRDSLRRRTRDRS